MSQPSNPQTGFSMMGGKGIPVFTGKNFGHWKLKAEWHLASIHERMIDTLRLGPIIPMRPIPAIKEGDKVVEAEKLVETPRAQWTDADKIIYNLDNKAKSILGNAVSEVIFSKIAGCKTAKDIWDTLIVSYEGVDVVKTQRKKNLIRTYENFYAEEKEPLADIHTRFQILLNDLQAVGVVKTDEEVCQKFIDILPSSFETIITTLVVSEKLEDYTLSSLFGLLLNHEESKERRHKNSRRIAKDPNAALVATSKRNKEMFSRADYDLEQRSESDSDSDSAVSESEAEKLRAEIALLTQRLEKSSGYKGKSPFDPKKATCFKCGIKGHIAAECRSKNTSSAHIDYVAERAQKYRKKYLNLKNGGAQRPQKQETKALYAEDWLDEELSSDEEEQVEDMCLMAQTEEESKEYLQFDKDLKEAERLCNNTGWNKSMTYKVHNFKLYNIEQKQKMFEYLYLDFKDSLTEIEDLKLRLKQVKDDLKDSYDQIVANEDYKVSLNAQEKAYSDLAKQNHKLRLETENYKNICKSWCISSRKVDDCLSKQIPSQIQAVLGEDFNLQTHMGQETNSKPKKFESDILPNTFSYTIGTKRVLTNAFVRPQALNDKKPESESESDKSDSEKSESDKSNSDLENVCLKATHDPTINILLKKDNMIKAKQVSKEKPVSKKTNAPNIIANPTAATVPRLGPPADLPSAPNSPSKLLTELLTLKISRPFKIAFLAPMGSFNGPT